MGSLLRASTNTASAAPVAAPLAVAVPLVTVAGNATPSTIAAALGRWSAEQEQWWRRTRRSLTDYLESLDAGQQALKTQLADLVDSVDTLRTDLSTLSDNLTAVALDLARTVAAIQAPGEDSTAVRALAADLAALAMQMAGTDGILLREIADRLAGDAALANDVAAVLTQLAGAEAVVLQEAVVRAAADRLAAEDTALALLSIPPPGMDTTAIPVSPSSLLYFDDAASDVSGYHKLLTVPNTTTAEQDDYADVRAATSPVLIEKYVSEPGFPGTTVIPGGTWYFEMWAYVSGTAGVSQLRVDVYKMDTGETETLFFQSTSPRITSTTLALVTWESTQGDLLLAETDRTVTYIYALATHAVDIRVHYTHNGTTHYSHIHAPIPTVVSPGGSTSPTTTKGDLIVRGTEADDRFAVGVDGQMIVADSTEPLGMRWTGVSPLPDPINGVLVGNGVAWYTVSGVTGDALIMSPSGPIFGQVAGITWDPNAGQPQILGQTLLCNWASNGDGNGAFYAIGSNIRRNPWANPSPNGVRWLESASFVGGGNSLNQLTDRSDGGEYFQGSGSWWFAWDMGSLRQMGVTDYTIRESSNATTPPRTWVLAGSNNLAGWTTTDIAAATWVTIDTRTNDTTLNAAGAWGHWGSAGGGSALTGDTTTRFRYFRFSCTNPSLGYSAVTEIELYGSLTVIDLLLDAGTYSLTYASAGDGNGLGYFYGTIGLARVWSNPTVSGLITALANSSGSPTSFLWGLTNREVTEGSNSLAFTAFNGAWLCWDLGSGNTCSISDYTLRQSSNTTAYLRSWVLEGSNNVVGWTTTDIDAATWTAIDTRTNDTTLNGAGVWGNWTSGGDSTTSYRWLRLRGVALSTGNTLYLGEVDFYGTLTVS